MSFLRRLTTRITTAFGRLLGRAQPPAPPLGLSQEAPTVGYPGSPLQLRRSSSDGPTAPDGPDGQGEGTATAPSQATTAPADIPSGLHVPGASPLSARPMPRGPEDVGPDEASTDPQRGRHARTTDKVKPPEYDPLAATDVQLQHGPPAGLWLNPGPIDLATALSTSDVAMQRAVDLLVRDRMVVFDVGAGFGLCALVAARRCPEGRVIAFEPVPEHGPLLERSASRSGLLHVQLERSALGEREGEARFHLSRRPGHGRLDVAGLPPEPSGFLQVQVRTVDQVVGKNAAPPPDLLVVDVEGAEASVLRGAAHVLRAARPIVVLSLHGTGAAIAKLLDSFGFDAFALGAGDSRPPGASSRWAVGFPRERVHLQTYVGPLSHRAIVEPDRMR